jgi:hypothetical protein
MTMSLVTISAGAAEYKDLTDKDEIQYEEAVTVLNRLGIITGYTDGSFQPKKELTRGAAAKIIVSLLIGTEAANNLVATAAPYSDVPVDNTFAGVIGFCKTSGIINGYSDGSFRPTGTLSGYAFAKMLLGALGYKGEYENGFTGSGWTMNVARIGNSAGLFDRLTFKGNETVNREQACQLALNTLKGTLVEYKGGFTVNAGDASVVGAQQRSYITSNQEFASHISSKRAEDDFYTVEFGEEHFVDLRLEHDAEKGTPAEDDFGRPSNEWSYKKVTIGTFPIEADFTFTEQKAHVDDDKDAVKERAIGLGKYDVESDAREVAASWDETHVFVNGKEVDNLDKVATIADYTDNGATVQVYVDNKDADFISHVVVTQPMLVEVKRVGSDYVSLDLKGADDKGKGFNQFPLDNDDVVASVGGKRGMAEIGKLEDVQEDDDAYAVLSSLKAGDNVVVIPVASDRNATSWKVARAYVPETVTGKLTQVETYDGDVTTITVGGTTYKVSQWNKDMKDIDADKIKVTNKDVTLTLDEMGCALLAEDVGATSDYMVIGGWSQSLVDGKLINIVDGWDISGNAISLNVGKNTYKTATRYNPGDLVKYSNEGAAGTADWVLDDGYDETPLQRPGDTVVKNYSKYEDMTKIYEVNYLEDGGNYVIKSSNVRLALKGVGYQTGMPATPSTAANANGNNNGAGWLVSPGKGKSDAVSGVNAGDATPGSVGDFQRTGNFYMAKNVKFIYTSFNEEGDVDNVEIVSGAQNVTNAELRRFASSHSAQAYVNKDGEVAAVVIKSESTNALSTNLLYIREHWGLQGVEVNGKKVYGYKVAMMNADGTVSEDVTIYGDKDLRNHTFATYSASTLEGYEPYYTIRSYDAQCKNTSIVKATLNSAVKVGGGAVTAQGERLNKWLLRLSNPITDGDGDALTAATTTPGENVSGYSWIMTDTRGNSDSIELGTGNAAFVVRVTGKTQWVGLNNIDIDDIEDFDDFEDIELHMIVNDNPESDTFRDVALIVVAKATRNLGTAPAAQSVTLAASPDKLQYNANESVVLTANADLNSLRGVVTYEWSKDGFTTVDSTTSVNTKTVTADTTTTWSVRIRNHDTNFSRDGVSAVANKTLAVDAASVTFPVTVNLVGCTGTFGGDTTTSFTLDVGSAAKIITGLTLRAGYVAPMTVTADTGIDATLEGDKLFITATAAGTVTVEAVEVVDVTVKLNGANATKSGGGTLKSTDKVGDIDTIKNTGWILKEVTDVDSGDKTYTVAAATDLLEDGANYIDALTTLTLPADVTAAAPITGAAAATTLGSYTYVTAPKAGTTEGTDYYVVNGVNYLKSGAVFTVTITCETAGATQDKTDTVSVSVSNNGSTVFTVGGPVTWATETSGGTAAQTGDKTVDITMGSTADKQAHEVSLSGSNA